MGKKNNFKFILITIFFFLFFIESLSFVYLKIFSIDRELFLLENYAEKTSEKKITLKKNYIKNIKVNNWTVITSPIRTRVSSIQERARFDDFNKNQEEKFIFIGDSIPFGYGVNADKSLPYFFERENNFFVINASIPSFSISQSIERFKDEFMNIKNIKFVYLQAIDPINQYIVKGDKWKESDNWTNSKINQLRDKTNFIDLNIPIYGEPFIYVLFKELILQKTSTLSGSRNLKSDKRFKKHLEDKINELYEITNDIGATLILTTGTRNPKRIVIETEIIADNIFVEVLKNFSENKKNIIYFDSASIVKNLSEEYFIDNCCHLSEKGAKLLSKELTKIIK